MFDLGDLKLRRNTWVRAAGIPKHLIGWELSDCVEINSAVMAVVQDWISEVADGKVIDAVGQYGTCGKGLAFYGEPGMGKTTFAVAVIQEMMRSMPLDIFTLNDNRPCYFISYAALLDLKGETMEGTTEERETLYQGLFGESDQDSRNVKILIIDDVGKEHVSNSGWNRSMLHHILRTRFSNGLPTIVTSNIPLAKWGDMYGDATASFAHEAFRNIPLKSERGDLRK